MSDLDRPGKLSKNKNQVKDLNKIPPYSHSAEQSILGGLLIDMTNWDHITTILTETDFYIREHQIIFKSFHSLYKNNKPFDVLTLKEELNVNDDLDSVGGEIYLFELSNQTPSVSNIVAYADIVRERSVSRQLLSVANDVANTVYKPDGMSVNEIIDFAERKILAIGQQTRQSEGAIHIQEIMTKTVDVIDKLSQSDDPITGIPTGFVDFDHLTSGLHPSDLLIVAGRPSMGKTIYAMNIAENIAIKNKTPVLVFSMEMPGDSLAMRMISSLALVDQHKVRSGKIQDSDWARISSAISMLSEAPLFIDDEPNLSPADIRSRTRSLIKKHGNIGLVIIDYLQLMKIPGYKPEHRTAEISEVSRALKSLAREINTPVIALSQLNRSLEQRNDRRPIMSDLRDSGSIEQDADVISFIYRDEVYNEDTKDKGIAEIIIAKQRNGPIGKIKMAFRGQYTRFDNISYDRDY